MAFPVSLPDDGLIDVMAQVVVSLHCISGSLEDANRRS